MPCTDPGAWRDGYSDVSQSLEDVTKLLCSLCTILGESGSGNYIKAVDGLPTWWKQHQADDRRRIKQEDTAKRNEKEKKDALARLSPKERKLLGIWE